MDIRGYLQTSLNEWPGKVSAVIWVSGCNFRCPFCQNRDLILNPQKLPKLSEKKILLDLKKRRGWLDSLVITGGEPTLQTNLAPFLTKVKRTNLLTMMETNGSRPEIIRELLSQKLLDRISLDIKSSFDRYPQITQAQVPSSLIKESLRLILASGIDFELRTTIVPTLHTKESLIQLAKQLKEIIQNSKFKIQNSIWYLQQFVPQNCLHSEFEKIKPYSSKEMKVFLKAVRQQLPEAELRGL